MNTKKKRFEPKKEHYPKNVIIGVKESLKQADEGKLIPYKGIRNMLDLNKRLTKKCIETIQ